LRRFKTVWLLVVWTFGLHLPAIGGRHIDDRRIAKEQRKKDEKGKARAINLGSVI
jgi:hypothetical protein